MKRTCVVDGCAKPARSRTADWCPMHYHRWYRHGSVHAKPQNIKTGMPRAYRRVPAGGLPIADKSGRAYEHRVVLFHVIGGGEHVCHWCSRTVRWGDLKGTPSSLSVDHLNGIKDDNRPENLVPSCPSCNVARALSERHAELVAVGAWSGRDTIATLRNPELRRKDRFSAEEWSSTIRGRRD